MSKQYVVETSVGIFVVLSLLCVGYLTVKLGKVELLGAEYFPLKARFTSVTGLRTGNEVSISGVKVGQVSRITLDKEDFVSIVTMKIDKEIKISDDSMASIKTSGLIGDKYISISPGGSGMYLEPGEMILDTQPPIDIGELVSKYVFGNVKD
ncbi:MAG: outer membrane lipid asymmetry maintenance protein MlaD [Desulfohalobiaceae bacterium]|nr:outer membrane lipid asymmetry maintenance protein MlaD [Desulfohalobiaceae bacterium]